MAWKEMSAEELANNLGVNYSEAREKQKLMLLIVKTRKAKNLSQASLAKKLKISQSRVAQIESGVGTSKITFDVLLHVLSALGYDFKITAKKAA